MFLGFLCGRSLQEQHKGSLGKETQFLVFLVLCLTFLLSSCFTIRQVLGHPATIHQFLLQKKPRADDPEDFPKGNNIYSAQLTPGDTVAGRNPSNQWRHLKNPVKRLGYSPYQSYQLFNCFSDFFHQPHPHPPARNLSRLSRS